MYAGITQLDTAANAAGTAVTAWSAAYGTEVWFPWSGNDNTCKASTAETFSVRVATAGAQLPFALAWVETDPDDKKPYVWVNQCQAPGEDVAGARTKVSTPVAPKGNRDYDFKWLAANGHFHLLWVEAGADSSSPTRLLLKTREGETWQAPEVVANASTGLSRGLLVESTSGELTASWFQNQELWSRRRVGSSWQEATRLDEHALDTRLAVSGTGEVTVVVLNAQNALHSYRFANNSWQDDGVVSLPNAAISTFDVVAASNGEVSLIWLQDGVRARRWVNGAWQPNTLLSKPALAANALRLVVDSTNRVTALWHAESAVWANRFQ